MADSVTEGRPLAEASAIAYRFLELVRDCASEIMICGSVRRKKPVVNDIDIVAISRIDNVIERGWFDTFKVKRSFLHEKVAELILGKRAVARVKSDGKTMVGEFVALLEFDGMPLDLYYATKETWWGLVQMRTGSAAFNASIATRALSMGLKFHGDGNGVTKNGIRVDDGQSEEGIFKALGMKYLPPEARD
jgi:DNA polymerase/3'-5' exonuclease PolX